MNKSMRLLGLIFSAVLIVSTSVEAATCKSYRTCERAVAAWCAGQHSRADGDGDGIPCENVCKSLKKVNKIRKKIGC